MKMFSERLYFYYFCLKTILNYDLCVWSCLRGLHCRRRYFSPLKATANQVDKRIISRVKETTITAKKKVLKRTFSVRASRFVSFQSSDFFSYFGQLLFDFLGVWSGIKVIDHITVSLLLIDVTQFRGLHRGVRKCRYENRKQNSSEEIFHHVRRFETSVVRVK